MRNILVILILAIVAASSNEVIELESTVSFLAVTDTPASTYTFSLEETCKIAATKAFATYPCLEVGQASTTSIDQGVSECNRCSSEYVAVIAAMDAATGCPRTEIYKAIKGITDGCLKMVKQNDSANSTQNADAIKALQNDLSVKQNYVTDSIANSETAKALLTKAQEVSDRITANKSKAENTYNAAALADKAPNATSAQKDALSLAKIALDSITAEWKTATENLAAATSATNSEGKKLLDAQTDLSNAKDKVINAEKAIMDAKLRAQGQVVSAAETKIIQDALRKKIQDDLVVTVAKAALDKRIASLKAAVEALSNNNKDTAKSILQQDVTDKTTQRNDAQTSFDLAVKNANASALDHTEKTKKTLVFGLQEDRKVSLKNFLRKIKIDGIKNYRMHKVTMRALSSPQFLEGLKDSLVKETFCSTFQTKIYQMIINMNPSLSTSLNVDVQCSKTSGDTSSTSTSSELTLISVSAEGDNNTTLSFNISSTNATALDKVMETIQANPSNYVNVDSNVTVTKVSSDIAETQNSARIIDVSLSFVAIVLAAIFIM